MNRTGWTGLTLGVAVLAAALGWWAYEQRVAPPTPAPNTAGTAPSTAAPVDTAPAPASAAAPAADPVSAAASGTAPVTTGQPTEALWGQTYDQPDGTRLALAQFRGRPLLINFWATWCPPCVREMPQINQFAQEQAKLGQQGWQVVGIAVDSLTPVKSFLATTPVQFPVGLAGFGGTELARQLGNGTGGMPFTVMINAQGEIVHRKLGETNLQELQAWATAKSAASSSK